MTALGDLPSWRARLQLFASAGVACAVKDATGTGSPETVWTEWHTARARRAFQHALYADLTERLAENN